MGTRIATGTDTKYGEMLRMLLRLHPRGSCNGGEIDGALVANGPDNVNANGLLSIGCLVARARTFAQSISWNIPDTQPSSSTLMSTVTECLWLIRPGR